MNIENTTQRQPVISVWSMLTVISSYFYLNLHFYLLFQLCLYIMYLHMYIPTLYSIEKISFKGDVKREVVFLVGAYPQDGAGNTREKKQ